MVNLAVITCNISNRLSLLPWVILHIPGSNLKCNLSTDCYVGLVTVVAVGWRSGGLEAVGSENTEGSTFFNTHCLSIAICSGVCTEHTVGVWKRSLSKLIENNVSLLNPCSKGKYVTYSYMHTRNWSLLLKCRTYSLTFLGLFLFQPFKAGSTYKFNIDLWQVSTGLQLYLPAWFVVMFTAENWGV